MSCAADTEASVTLLPREIRLVVERILLLTALPPGFVPSVRDVVLYSAAAGLGGLPLLMERFEALKSADPTALCLVEPAPARLELSAGGQHAWIALPSALDLLSEAVEAHGAATLTLHDLADPAEALAACALGQRQGLTVFATLGSAEHGAPGPEGLLRGAGGAGSVTLFAAPAHGERPFLDPLLSRALREGVEVPAALWWRLHHLSNSALAPDSPESRRHAGAVMVMPDGTVVGRPDNDDETDFSMLVASPVTPETV